MVYYYSAIKACVENQAFVEELYMSEDFSFSQCEKQLKRLWMREFDMKTALMYVVNQL